MEENKQHIWTKKCPHCKKEFHTTARRQKFCSPECCKKAAKKKKEQQVRYSKIKEIERIRVRSHSLAVEILNQLAALGKREKKCEICGCTEKLHVHHINKFNWLDNTPSNLMWLCEKCHTKEHSRVENELNEQGILLSEWYEESMEEFYKILNKNSQK